MENRKDQNISPSHEPEETPDRSTAGDIDPNGGGTVEAEAETTERPERPCGESAATEKEAPEERESQYQEKIRQLEDKYLRLAAEFDNFRKRTARQFEDIVKSANENLIVQLLEVLDNFRRALEAGQTGGDFSSLRKGTELIYQHLEDILKKEGLEKIDAVGKEFDPRWHEAMMQTESDEFAPGMVAREISPGYTLNGKVIRHSRVAVSGGRSDGGVNQTKEAD
jgi:molecular chaperone GrpE